MAKISIAGIDNFDLDNLDDDLFFAVYSTITLPGFPGVKTKSLGNGLTELTVEFGGQQLGAIVKNYQGSAATGMTGGVIQSVLVYDEEDSADGAAVWAENLNLRVSDLLGAVQKAGLKGDFGPIASLIWKLDWTIVGDNNDNHFVFADELGAFGNVGVFSGNDKISGKGGNDIIELYKGNDIGIGGSGDDIIRGGKGADLLKGDGGKDKLFGNNGADKLKGGSSADELRGGGGNDVLIGQNGNDTLRGGSKNDVLKGGTGDDIHLGGSGADKFVFAANAGADVIIDYDPSKDTIQFKGIDGVSIASISGGVQITHSDGTIDVLGITTDDLTGGDILGW